MLLRDRDSGQEGVFRRRGVGRVAAQQDFKHPIVTEIVPLKKFYKAEDYHQEYYDNNSNAPYCQVVIAPKLEKLEQKKVIQETPQTVK